MVRKGAAEVRRGTPVRPSTMSDRPKGEGALGPLAAIGSATRCPKCGRDRPKAIVYGNYSPALAELEARGVAIYGGRIPRSLNRACRLCGHLWSGSLGDGSPNDVERAPSTVEG